MEWLIAGGIAAALTLFDLDVAFYVPRKINDRLGLLLLEGVFISVNAGLAIGLYFLLRTEDPFSSWNRWVAAAVVGTSYLALLTARLTTVKIQDQDVAVGVVPFYTSAKSYIYKRINNLITQARVQELRDRANSETLEQLVQDAKTRLRANNLMTKEKKQEALAWILKVITDKGASEVDKKEDIANFILSDQMS